MDGEVLNFGSNGVENGAGIISDEATWSNWEPMTGECTEGQYRGRNLDIWPVTLTTVAAARAERPDLHLSISGERSVRSWMLRKTWPKVLDNRGFIPPPFFSTMPGPIDRRMHRLQLGLGVMVGGRHLFYGLESIPKGGEVTHRVGSRTLQIRRGKVDGVPQARWLDAWGELDEEDLPMQMFTRWYAFSFRYPGCEIWAPRAVAEGS